MYSYIEFTGKSKIRDIVIAPFRKLNNECVILITEMKVGWIFFNVQLILGYLFNKILCKDKKFL